MCTGRGPQRIVLRLAQHVLAVQALRRRGRGKSGTIWKLAAVDGIRAGVARGMRRSHWRWGSLRVAGVRHKRWRDAWQPRRQASRCGCCFGQYAGAIRLAAADVAQR